MDLQVPNSPPCSGQGAKKICREHLNNTKTSKTFSHPAQGTTVAKHILNQGVEGWDTVTNLNPQLAQGWDTVTNLHPLLAEGWDTSCQPIPVSWGAEDVPGCPLSRLCE